ncbi:unnamed protein product [Owenia fusiformis]|uniref:DUF4187 domain-containing protein n=1 Tax=Owenia fusiformis TaxID=6347 RepID=A0A8S4N954_OWEFU|nr:unnamed protein product [Owenia fusiformis]
MRKCIVGSLRIVGKRSNNKHREQWETVMMNMTAGENETSSGVKEMSIMIAEMIGAEAGKTVGCERAGGDQQIEGQREGVDEKAMVVKTLIVDGIAMKRMRRDWEGDGGGYNPQHQREAYNQGHHGNWNNNAANDHRGGYQQGQRLEVDYPTQPPMMPFKHFLGQQDDHITDQEAIKKYNEYKLDFKCQQVNDFFLAHKDEEWFKAKYHPDECDVSNEESKAALNKRCEVFTTLLNMGTIDELSLDVEKNDGLIKMLDAAVILMEGGTENDLKVLDLPPEETEDDTRSRTTSESTKNEKPEDKEKEEEQKRKEEEEKKAKEAVAKAEGEEGMKTEEQEEEKKPGDTSNGKTTEEPKEEGETETNGPENATTPKKEAKKEKKKKVKERKDSQTYDYSESDSSSDSGSESEAEPAEPAPPGLEEPKPPGIEGETKESPNKEKTEESKENNEEPVSLKEEASAKEPEKEEDEKEEGEEGSDGAPRALHRTSSIFLRNLAPSITKQEVEAMCKRYPGFMRCALQDPQPERRFFRRGWVTFDRSVNIKDICWNLNNIRLRDCEMGAIVNRDLRQRVRPVNGITSHKLVSKSDIKHVAKIIQNFDRRWSLWENDNKDTEKQEFGLVSKNPVLKNITDFLVDEGSYEEEEMLGISVEEKTDAEKEATIERDEPLLKVLDRMIIYLRIVHSFDYYSAIEYPNEDEMPHRCGIIHARGPAPSSKILNDGGLNKLVNEWQAAFSHKILGWVHVKWTLDNEEATRLGLKDAEKEVEKFMDANCQELGKDKWLCPLSGKKFKGPEFVKKHVKNKYAEKIEDVKKEVEFFNNYLLDPKRPQLPEHPGFRPPAQPAPAPREYPQQQHGGYQQQGQQRSYRSPPRQHHDQHDRREGGGFSRQSSFSRNNRSQKDPRGIVGYQDLDAPDDLDIF